MGDLTDSMTPSTTTATPPSYSRPLPVREDCWSEEATSTLVDSWGRRYLELNRGNLRQKDWQDVADTVNALHAVSKKTHRTDVQCKNRIDTIKKKYKVEKARVTSSNGTLTSSWPFFDRMDSLIGNSVKSSSNFSPNPSPSPPVALPIKAYRKPVSNNNNNNNINNNNNSNSSPSLTPIQAATVVALPQKRGYNSDGYYRNYSAVAAAAAAAESEEEDAEEDAEEEENESEENLGVRKLAKAIERFGEVYERVEAEKLKQMVELEKQRMQFASELEMQRLRMFTEMQVQLERNKRSKRSGSNDMDYLCTRTTEEMMFQFLAL